MLSKALEMGVCFRRGPLLENKEGHSFLSAFEKRKKKILFRGIFVWVSRYMQKCPVNASLHRGPVEVHGGGLFARMF
jgi:hypothetical protein